MHEHPHMSRTQDKYAFGFLPTSSPNKLNEDVLFTHLFVLSKCSQRRIYLVSSSRRCEKFLKQWLCCFSLAQESFIFLLFVEKWITFNGVAHQKFPTNYHRISECYEKRNKKKSSSLFSIQNYFHAPGSSSLAMQNDSTVIRLRCWIF